MFTPQYLFICLFQKCMQQEKSERLVGKQPTWTTFHIPNTSFILSHMLFSNRNSNREQNPRCSPGSPASPEQVNHSHLSPQPFLAFTVSSTGLLQNVSSFFLSFPSAALRKAPSIQNVTKIEKPWENVTLNRCLFVAITILVLTSGVQRLHGK